MNGRWAARLALALLGGLHAAAAPAARLMTCTAGSFALLTPAPARIIVPAATAPGGALWGGTVSVSFSCTSTAKGAKLGGGSSEGGTAQAAMVSSSGAPDGVSMVSAGRPALVLSSPGCALTSLAQHAKRWTFGLVSTAAGTCRGSLVVPVQLVRGSGAVGADVAATNPLGLGIGGANWVVFPTRRGSTASVGLSGPVPLLAGGGCTVSPVALTVALPTVSVAALATPGSSAGATAFRFPLQTCQALPATPYSVYASWSFSAVAGYPSVIANSAAGPAGHVGVQIVDASGAAVLSGPSGSTLAGNVSASGGVAAQIYIARYFATGRVTPGAVRATATYTLTYQ